VAVLDYLPKAPLRVPESIKARLQLRALINQLVRAHWVGVMTQEYLQVTRLYCMCTFEIVPHSHLRDSFIHTLCKQEGIWPQERTEFLAKRDIGRNQCRLIGTGSQVVFRKRTSGASSMRRLARGG
jgi:hypothetical protein